MRVSGRRRESSWVMLRIAEIFRSIQGEGLYTGTPSVFVRTSGCNLRCWYCDTPYTSWTPEGELRSWQSVLAEINEFATEHVVLTGGEPLLQPDIVPLSQALREAGYFVTVETAGTVVQPVSADLMSISPKLANSTPSSERSPLWSRRHEELRERPEVMRQLLWMAPSQVKFVIDSPADLADVERFLTEIPEILPEQVWLMPQGITPEAVLERGSWLAEQAVKRGWRYCPRLHIEQFGNVRGT